MVLPNVGHGAFKGWIPHRVVLHFCLDIVPSHIEESEVGAQCRSLECEHVRLVLLFKPAQPIKMGTEKSWGPLRRVLHSIVQISLPFKKCKVPSKIPEPQA